MQKGPAKEENGIKGERNRVREREREKKETGLTEWMLNNGKKKQKRVQQRTD